MAATPLWVRWTDLDMGGGNYYWSDIDQQIEALRACGLEVALHVQVARPWQSNNRPIDLDAYSRFLTALATHLRGKVQRYSIENEANASNMWPDPPETYFELLDRAYPAIKAGDPGALVQNAGVSSGGLTIMRVNDLFHSGKQDEALALIREYQINSPGADDKRMIETLAELNLYLQSPGARRHIDWMVLEVAHQHSYDLFQMHYYGPWESLPPLMRWIRGQGIVKPIEVWELGKRYGRQPYEEAAHAEETVKLLVSAAGEGSGFTIYVRYNDWDEKFLPGLRGVDGPYMAAAGFRVAAEKLHGAITVGWLDLGVGVWAYRFTRPQGDVIVAWATGSGATVDIPLPGDVVTITDISGEVHTYAQSTVHVSTSPLFIE